MRIWETVDRVGTTNKAASNMGGRVLRLEKGLFRDPYLFTTRTPMSTLRVMPKSERRMVGNVERRPFPNRYELAIRPINNPGQRSSPRTSMKAKAIPEGMNISGGPWEE
jgi:hypothetical protein